MLIGLWALVAVLYWVGWGINNPERAKEIIERVGWVPICAYLGIMSIAFGVLVIYGVSKFLSSR